MRVVFVCLVGAVLAFGVVNLLRRRLKPGAVLSEMSRPDEILLATVTEDSAVGTWVTEEPSEALVASRGVVATRGFVNMGNTCYLNALLQVLVHSESVRNSYDSFLLPNDESPLSLAERTHNEFGLLVRQQWDVSGGAISPSRFFALLEQFDSTFFREGAGQDAHEAFMSLLAAVENPRKVSLTNLFRFAVMKDCTSCEAKLTVENQVIIPLEENGNILSISSGVAGRFESLDGVRCDDEVQRIHSYPKLLLVVIHRSNSVGQKIHTRVLLDRRLTFGTRNYQLMGVVHHVGNCLHSGHYTADFYHSEDERWYHADDSTVETLRHSHLESRTAYILLYELS